MKMDNISMEPTLYSGDVLYIEKKDDMVPGDIIVLRYNEKKLVKRLIAFEGDTVEIDDNGYVTVNGTVLNEPYVEFPSLGECDIEFPFTVPEGTVFVLGDNRNVSIDSRSSSLGCIEKDHVVGKVVYRLFPFKRIGKVE